MIRRLIAYITLLTAAGLLLQAGQQSILLSHKRTTATSTAFVTSYTPGTARNDQTYCVGSSITVGGAGITVTHLGRWVISGNSLTHKLHLANASGTELGQVTVNTSGAASGAFLYGALGSPVALSASTKYYVLSDELITGDQWYSSDGTVTTTAVGSMAAAYVLATCAAVTIVGITDAGSVPSTYIPVDIKY